MFLDVLFDTVIDCVKLLPFLFIAFLLIEVLEHYASESLRQGLWKVRKAGPIIGALCGCIPQCGFSVLAANLYAGGVISTGTLMSVFLATSDEALIIIFANPGYLKDMGLLILVKLIISVAAGYITDMLLSKHIKEQKAEGDLCRKCGCGHTHSVIKPALRHTFKIFIYLFVIMLILDLCVEGVGKEAFSNVLLGNSIFQPFIAALIGFIPNCAASVILTQLYLEGIISFASVTAGLCTGAGAGLLVLYKVNARHMKENVKITVLLYAFAVIAGCILTFIS